VHAVFPSCLCQELLPIHVSQVCQDSKAPMMPSKPTQKRSMRSRPQASKQQQVSFAAEDGKVRNEQSRKSTRGTSRAPALAACGAKRKRKEAGGSDNEGADGDNCPEEPNYVAGAAARTDAAGSDQHTVNTEGSARVRRSGRQTAKARAAEPQGQPSFASARGRRPVSAPAISISRTADTVRQPLSPTGQGINRAATSAAVAAAAASFGKRKSPVADRPSSAPSSLAGMIPSGTGQSLCILVLLHMHCISPLITNCTLIQAYGYPDPVASLQGQGLLQVRALVQVALPH
jgi:hypothetical protein